MRKYRAKRLDNNEWIYGSIYRLSENLNPFIMLIDKCGESYEVDPSTIGQYIGRKDKNDNAIYEDDILKVATGYVGEDSGEVEYYPPLQVIYNSDKCCYLASGYGNPEYSSQLWELPFDKLKNIEIIGDIYKNSDMLFHEECENEDY